MDGSAKTRKAPRARFKETTWEKYKCPVCEEVLESPQQLSCGHWCCLECVTQLTRGEGPPPCPVKDCDERIAVDGDGGAYFPDRAVKKEIDSFAVECSYSVEGCTWQGVYGELLEHIQTCEFGHVVCQQCETAIELDKFDDHKKNCQGSNAVCPYHAIGCSSNNAMPRSNLQEHCTESLTEHGFQVVKAIKSAEKNSNDALEKIDHISKQVHLLTVTQGKLKMVEKDGAPVEKAQGKAMTEIHLRDEQPPVKRLPMGYPSQEFSFDATLFQPHLDKMQQDMLSILRVELSTRASGDGRRKDAEIATLKERILQLEKSLRAKTAEAEDRDFRLSLIENSNYDGNMVWKIPQFSQRKADAESGKYTSIFSLPFYTGRYGYKMCLRLYILGDGVGKNSHMSLFFVVMRGEFDNILQWPFAHKVTFKLINQKGARDVIDTFQPDPMSSSFRKPKSDMNIASGCPRFVSYQELQNGFIEDDTIFIKCIIDKTNLRNP